MSTLAFSESSLDILKRVMSGAGIVFPARVAGLGLMFVLQLALAHWMGADQLGAYIYALSWASLLGIATSMGLAKASLRFISTYTAAEKHPELAGLMYQVPIVLVAVSALAALSAIFLVVLLGDIVPAALQIPLICAFVSVPFLVLMQMNQEFARAFGRAGFAYIPQTVLRPLLVIAVVSLLFLATGSMDAATAAAITTASVAILAICQFIAVRRLAPEPVRSVSRRYETGTWFTVAMPLWVIAGALFLMGETDILMLGFFVSSAEVAVYGIAVKVAGLVVIVFEAFNAITAREVARLYHGGQKAELQRLVSQVVHLVFWPSLAVTLGLVLCGPWILALFGEEFTAGYTALLILAVGQTVAAAAGPAPTLLNMTGYERINAVLFVCIIALNIVLNAILIPKFGITGAAIATMISMSMRALVTVLVVRSRIFVHCFVIGTSFRNNVKQHLAEPIGHSSQDSEKGRRQRSTPPRMSLLVTVMDSIRTCLREARDYAFYPRFRAIKKAANGMLSVRVYAEIYRTVARAPDLDVIEIGAAGGAGSVSAAMALKDSGKWGSQIITIEKCEGGSRSDTGDKTDNLNALETVFHAFDVEDRIHLYPRYLTIENGAEVQALVRTPGIGCLIHDADGRIDRDMLLFWPMLVAGGAIIIDDYDDRMKFQPVSDRYPLGGIKNIVTFHIVNQLIDWGMIEPVRQIGNTLFATKPHSATMDSFDMQHLHRIIERVEAQHENWQQQETLSA